MNKFMKLAIVILVIAGLSFTVYRVSQKGGTGPDGQQVTDAGEIGGEGGSGPGAGTSGGQASEGEDKDKVAGHRAGSKDGDEGNSDDFMGGVTGKSAGGDSASGSGSGGSAGAQQDPNVTLREDGSKTAGGVGVSAPGVGGVTGSAPGMGGANGVAGTGTTKSDNNCFSFEYKHQKEALNKDIEEFLDYSNAFPVLHDKVAANSICVKVNNKPVAHKLSKFKNQQEVVIGSVVGPESVIKVSYCVGTAKCKEACAVKSNRFMDDLMSDTGDEDEFKESWGDAKEQKKELTAKVKEFRNVASENKDLQKQSTIRSWDTVQTNEWVCKK